MNAKYVAVAPIEATVEECPEKNESSRSVLAHPPVAACEAHR
jgi:hypothetical protein